MEYQAQSNLELSNAEHQQATHMLGQIKRRFANQPLKPYRYRDFDSLVSLGKFSTVGNTMGGLIGKNLMIEARMTRVDFVQTSPRPGQPCELARAYPAAPTPAAPFAARQERRSQ